MHRFDIKKCLHMSGLLGLKKKTSILLLITILLIIPSGCKKAPTEPGKDNPPPGRRDYTWTVDTLTKSLCAYGMFLFSNVGHIQLQDVWCIGVDGYIDKECILHYDGSTWKKLFLFRIKILIHELYSDLQTDDFWVGGGTDGSIFRYY